MIKKHYFKWNPPNPDDDYVVLIIFKNYRVSNYIRLDRKPLPQRERIYWSNITVTQLKENEHWTEITEKEAFVELL